MDAKLKSINLNSLISRKECGGLNIDGDPDISPVFNNDNSTIKSNSGDATLITFIKFAETVNITSIQINGVSSDTNPSLIKCYVNKLDIDFSDVNDAAPTEKFDLTKNMNKPIKVYIPKWRSVSELTIYFENEEADYLEIKSIQFMGTPGNRDMNIGEMKKMDDENYVPIKKSELTEMIYNLNKGETIEDFINKNPGKVIFVDFHAKWCGPCKQLGPILCQRANEIGAIVLKIDIDQHKNIANENGINSIPVVWLYKNGVRIQTMVGFNPQKLEELINLARN